MVYLNEVVFISRIFLQHRTPLHYAAQAGSEPCCKLLLQANANVNLADRKVSRLTAGKE